jgi:hypothetical protein
VTRTSDADAIILGRTLTRLLAVAAVPSMLE